MIIYVAKLMYTCARNMGGTDGVFGEAPPHTVTVIKWHDNSYVAAPIPTLDRRSPNCP